MNTVGAAWVRVMPPDAENAGLGVAWTDKEAAA